MSATYLRSCVGKRRHANRDAALVARRNLAGARGIRVDRLTAYRCIQCGAWHVGHASGRGSR